MDYYHRTPNRQSYFNSFDKFELVSVHSVNLVLCNDVEGIGKWVECDGSDIDWREKGIEEIPLENSSVTHFSSKASFVRNIFTRESVEMISLFTLLRCRLRTFQ